MDAKTKVSITYLNKDFNEIRTEEKAVDTSKGKALVEITPPKESVALVVECSAEGASTSKTLQADYSPSGNFIHVEQVSEGVPNLGGEIRFKVYSTREAANFYYEVVARDKVVFSDYTTGNEIFFNATPTRYSSTPLH